MSSFSLIEAVRESLEKNSDVVFAYVYGSQVEGRTGRFSDLDVAVYLKDTSHEKFMNLLACLPADIEVDVRLLNDAPPLFRYNVVRKGRVIVVKDEEAHRGFLYDTLVSALELKDDISKLREEKFRRILHAPRPRH